MVAALNARFLVAPEPAQRVGQDRAAMAIAVKSLAVDELKVIFGKLE
jgi:hypothetical protein